MKISRDITTKPKVGMISLGCAKNLVDAEIMLGSVLQRGMEVTSRPEDADVLVVNTCAFIDSAKEESIEAILEAHQQRGLNRRPHQKLIVSGCMSQRFAKELRQEMPEVDAFIGLDQVGELGEIVEKIVNKRRTLNAKRPMLNPENSLLGGERSALGVSSENGEVDLAFADTRPTYIPDYDTPRFRLTPTHFAYLKIAEGCNHPCSFCVIPQMRGKHRSRPPESVLAEIRALVETSPPIEATTTADDPAAWRDDDAADIGIGRTSTARLFAQPQRLIHEAPVGLARGYIPSWFSSFRNWRCFSCLKASLSAASFFWSAMIWESVRLAE